MPRKKKIKIEKPKLMGLTCCICGNLYDESKRPIHYFQYLDLEKFEIKTQDHIDINGRTLALCPTCMKAVAFGRLELSKQEKYQFYRPDLMAPMFEDEQNIEIAKNTPF